MCSLQLSVPLQTSSLGPSKRWALLAVAAADVRAHRKPDPLLTFCESLDSVLADAVSRDYPTEDAIQHSK